MTTTLEDADEMGSAVRVSDSAVRVSDGSVQDTANNVTLIIVIRGLESLVNVLIIIHIMPYGGCITLNTGLAATCAA